MAELSTPALRRAVKSFSDEVTLYSEMMSAGAIRSGADHNLPLSRIYDFDQPVISQLMGRDPAAISAAAEILAEQNCAGININMACPAPDIVRKGCGAKLFTEPELAAKIIRSCRSVVKKELSVKLRSGYDSFEKNTFISFIKMLEDEGTDFIIIHPRWAKLSFTRKADWRIIALAKEKIKIPVIGNGDITTPEQALSAFNKYGCDGIMIGREAVKSPWIFKLCSILEKRNGETLEIDFFEVARDILTNIKKFLPENLHKSRGHRFSFYYSKNAVYSHELFKKIRRMSDPDSIISVFHEYYHRNPHEKYIKFSEKKGTIIRT